MQTTEYGFHDNAMTVGNPVALLLAFDLWARSVRYSGPKAAMRSSSVVMCRPGFHDLRNVRFIKRDHVVQTLAARTTDQPFTEGIGLRRAIGRSQYPQPERLQRRIEILGVDIVPIMDDEFVASPPIIHSRNCCSVHSAVVWRVTWTCRIRRVPTSIIRNT